MKKYFKQPNFIITFILALILCTLLVMFIFEFPSLNKDSNYEHSLSLSFIPIFTIATYFFATISTIISVFFCKVEIIIKIRSIIFTLAIFFIIPLFGIFNLYLFDLLYPNGYTIAYFGAIGSFIIAICGLIYLGMYPHKLSSKHSLSNN